MVREFLAVAARAALQWALSTLLLTNGAAFCLIAAAAAWLRLGPPCVLCARVHRLLCPSSGQERDAVRRILCDAHLAAVAASVAPKAEHHEKRSASDHVDGRERKGGVQADEFGAGLDANRVVSIGSEICEQDHGDNDERPHTIDGVDVARTSSVDNDDPYVSLFELAPIVEVPLPQDNSDHVQELDDMPELQREGVSGQEAAGERLTVDRLVAALRAQRRELEALREELDGERRARAEAAEYQRQLEEQAEFDREAVRLAMQLVHETETEKHGLQRQLDACRVRAQLYESSMDAASPPLSRPAAKQEANGNDDGDGNNYQSLVDFLPGSVYSSSPDLANLLKLYTEGNGSARRPRGDPTDGESVVQVIAEEEEEVVAVTGTSASDTIGNGETLSTSVAGASVAEAGSNLVETTEAASLR